MSKKIKLEQNLFSENCNKILKLGFVKVKRNKIQRFFCLNQEIPSNWHIIRHFYRFLKQVFKMSYYGKNYFTKFESSVFAKKVTKLVKSTNRFHVKTLTFLVVHGSVNCYYAKSSVKSNLSEIHNFHSQNRIINKTNRRRLIPDSQAGKSQIVTKNAKIRFSLKNV